MFYALQVLDVYTTDRALQYSCVEEVNPILGKSPTVTRLIRTESILTWSCIWYTISMRTITDKDLAVTNSCNDSCGC